MYGLLRQNLTGVEGSAARGAGWFNWAVVGRTVLLLGLTSLLTDISSEMVSAVLPLYLLYQLHVSALQLGVVDGLYQGAAGLVRLGAALSADRWARHKEVAASGYALSAISRVGLLAVGGALSGIAGFVLLDRIGKGVRTAPRDALISLSVPQERLGLAFGVHRTLDTAGALVGPLLAFGLLSMAPTAFDVVFLPSFTIALIGLGVIVLLVENQRGRASAPEAFKLIDAARLVLAPRFRLLVICAGLLAMFTASDAFIYVALQRRSSLALAYFPLLYVGTSAFYLVLALPAGRLADRVSRARVFVMGQVVMLVALGLLLLPGTDGVLFLVLPCLGIYYALTDGVLMAAASAELSEHLRTSGLGVLTTVTSLSSLCRRCCSAHSGRDGACRWPSARLPSCSVWRPSGAPGRLYVGVGPGHETAPAGAGCRESGAGRTFGRLRRVAGCAGAPAAGAADAGGRRARRHPESTPPGVSGYAGLQSSAAGGRPARGSTTPVRDRYELPARLRLAWRRPVSGRRGHGRLCLQRACAGCPPAARLDV
jgi:MFS family permease